MARLLTNLQVRRIEELWQQGETADIVCFELGITRDYLNERRKDQLRHLGKRKRGVGGGPRNRPDPTGEEIEQITALIRSRWSDEERENRIVGPAKLQVFRWEE